MGRSRSRSRNRRYMQWIAGTCWQIVGLVLPSLHSVFCLLWHTHARCINLNKSDIAFFHVQLQMPLRRRCAMSTCSLSHQRFDVVSRWCYVANISWMVHHFIRLSSIADSWSFIALLRANIHTPRSFNILGSKWM